MMLQSDLKSLLCFLDNVQALLLRMKLRSAFTRNMDAFRLHL